MGTRHVVPLEAGEGHSLFGMIFMDGYRPIFGNFDGLRAVRNALICRA